MRAPLVLVIVVMGALLGCGASRPPAHAALHKSDANIDGAEMTESFADVPPGTVNGTPQAVQPGTAPTYWVWKDDKGWHLRTTADKPFHFNGQVGGEYGPVANAQPSRAELAKTLRVAGGTATFHFTTGSADVDGIDFVPAQPCVHVELDLDDGPTVAKLLVGGNAKDADTGHVLLCP